MGMIFDCLQNFNEAVEQARTAELSFCPVCARRDTAAGFSLADAMAAGQESKLDEIDRTKVFRYFWPVEQFPLARKPLGPHVPWITCFIVPAGSAARPLGTNI